MAMRHAPGLKAILAVDATAELFHDDVHYVDGIAHIDEFELNMDMAEGWVGAPDYSLEEKTLGPRFDSPPWSLLYLRHQHDGPFWRDRVRPLSEITIPSFLIGGLQDGYRDNVPDMLMQSKAPIKAIVGPWNHSFPNDADFGPRVEWRDQAVRWFDYWLKGRDTGIREDPRLVIFMQHWHPPDPNLQEVPGEWRREDVWPPQRCSEYDLLSTVESHAGQFRSECRSSSTEICSHDRRRSRLLVGRVAQRSTPGGRIQPRLRFRPADRRSRDSRSAARVAARIGNSSAGELDCASLRCSSGRHSHADYRSRHQRCAARLDDRSADLIPGKVYPLDIEMHLTSWVFPKGHRIRVAISNALWPMMLPTPYAMTTSLELGSVDGSRLVLPIVPVHGAAPPPFSAPEPMEERTDIKSEGFPWPGDWTVERDEAHQKTTVHWKGKDGYEYPWGTETDLESLTYEGDDAHPETCSVRGEAESTFALKGRTLIWRGHLLVTTDQKNFYYKYTRELLKDGQMLKSKTWQETIPRDHQ